jgi:hypothetical protein
MKSRNSFPHKTLPVIALLCAASLPDLAAQDAPTEAPAVENGQAGLRTRLFPLGKAAERFVAAFNNRDAAAIAALFTPLGEIVGSDGETLGGRQAIEDYYRGLFAGDNGSPDRLGSVGCPSSSLRAWRSRKDWFI